LCNIKEFRKIVLIGTHIVPKIKFHHGVYSFRLPIGLGVEACGEVQIRPHDLEYLRPKSSREPWVSIAHDRLWHTPVLHHIFEEELRRFFRGTIGWCGDKGSIFGESVHHHDYASAIL
jgi:hypothetical protein